MYAMFVVWTIECYTLPKSSLRSSDFVVVRFLMKLFKTVNDEIIRECCSYFKFTLPSELLDSRRVKFKKLCYVLVYCIILESRYNMIMYLS